MSKKAAPLDARDRAILRHLEAHGRATNAELGARVHLSETAALRRVRALEACGAIAGYGAVLDQRAVGLPLDVFLTVTLTSQAEPVLTAFEAAARAVPEIMECWLLTGDADYLMRVVASGIESFERLHATRLTRLPHVARITSRMVLRAAVRRRELPLVP